MNTSMINEEELTEQDRLIIALIQSFKTETQSLVPSIEGVRLIGELHNKLNKLTEDEKKTILS